MIQTNLRLAIMILVASLAFGCQGMRPFVNGLINAGRDLSAVGGSVNVGPIKVSGSYDGNGGVTGGIGFDIFGLVCKHFDYGCLTDSK